MRLDGGNKMAKGTQRNVEVGLSFASAKRVVWSGSEAVGRPFLGPRLGPDKDVEVA